MTMTDVALWIILVALIALVPIGCVLTRQRQKKIHLRRPSKSTDCRDYRVVGSRRTSYGPVDHRPLIVIRIWGVKKAARTVTSTFGQGRSAQVYNGEPRFKPNLYTKHPKLRFP